MTRLPSYCTVSECETETREGRIRCELHEKRYQRGQSLTTPKVERLSPRARVVEAAIRLADAETDEEFEKAERDVLRAAKQLAPSAHSELVRQGMAGARRRGVRLGRPASLTRAEAIALVSRHGSLRAAVRAGAAGRNTLRRALRQGPERLIVDPSCRMAA